MEPPHVAVVYPSPFFARSWWKIGAEWYESKGCAILAAAEARQTPPIARAILAAAAELELQLPAIDQVHYDSKEKKLL